MVSKALRGAGYTLAGLGLVVLFFVLYELVGTSMITNRHQGELREQFQAQIFDPVMRAPSTETPPAEEPSPSPSAPPEGQRPRPGEAAARILIPSIDVDMIVVEGIELKYLARGPGHYPGSAFFGEEGSVAIAGHRTGWGSPFIDLDKLRAGDEIIVERPEATYRYTVTRSAIVEPNDTWVLDGDPESEAEFTLTLTTCTPKWTSRDRLIIWAELAEYVPNAAGEGVLASA